MIRDYPNGGIFPFQYMHEEGVTVRQDTVLRSLDGYDRVQQLTFRDGLTVVADVVVVAIGLL